MRIHAMKVCVLLGVLVLFGQSWAACPEQPVDAGECDTLYVNIHPPDQQPSAGPPYFARFPIRVTNDIVDPSIDSLAGFTVPLCFTHSNASAYCSLSNYWNTCFLCWKGSAYERDIFRHLDGETNWVMWQWEHSPVHVWDYSFLDLDGTSHFWLNLVATGAQDQRFWGGSRILLATMTFKLQDTMSVCIDSCFWPPAAHLAFSNSAAQSYVPRDNMPICEFVGQHPHPPVFTSCPADVHCNSNGTFSGGPWEAEDAVDNVAEVSAEFVGSGVTDIEVWYYGFPPPPLGGYIRFDVVDHCASGGTITITARDQAGYESYCEFDVVLGNDPPVLSMRDTLLTIPNATRSFGVWGTDPNNDVVGTSFDGMWCEADSLRPPAYAPSFHPGNPGSFSWGAAESDTGTWISSFSATDICGSAVSGRVAIVVGPLFCGNLVEDETIQLSDVIYLSNYLYRGGPPPNPACKADVNCDGIADLGDYVYLINYLYKFGDAPCFGCCGR